MANLGSPDRRVGILLVNLALVGACILGLLLAALWYRASRPLRAAVATVVTPSLRPSLLPSTTATITPSPTITRTPAPSLTPTITQTPTRTGTVTPTPTSTPFPQLTPARASILSDSYRLRMWTPDDADHLGRMVQGYPEALVSASGADRDQTYYAAYRFAVNAWREALLRFPDAPQAQAWRWNLAFDLARTGSAEAGKVYAGLIADALNQSDTQIPYLYEWFVAGEPRLSLLMTAAEPPDGYLSSYVVELKGEYGSAFVWLLESASAFEAYPLQANFDPVARPESNWIVADLNGDAQDGREAAIYQTGSASPFAVSPPRVFRLDGPPAGLLPFLPDADIFRMGAEFTNYWAVAAGLPGRNELQFRGEAFPLCPTRVTLSYRWNGQYFRRVGEAFNLQPAEKTLAYCQAVVDYAISAWGPGATLELMQPLAGDWPPAAGIDGKPYPADARDEWDFRRGVYHALLGEREQAVALFNRISTQPTVYNSAWIQPAQAFLGAYQSPEDIYVACQAAPHCNPAHAIQYLVSLAAPNDNIWEALKRAGVNPNASGYFDFDGDEQKERWFTTRYRERQAPEFWILVQHEEGFSALNVATVENVPPEIEYLEDAFLADDGRTRLPAVFLENKLAFRMLRLPDTQEPYLVPAPLRKEYPSKFFVPLEAARNALLAGAEPKGVQRVLLDLQDYPGLLCRGNWSCDEYYYYLGLASELAGDSKRAVEAYHRLWLDYSRSPYTTMARLKLIGEGEPVFPVSTASPTPTSLTPTPLVPTLPGQTPTPSATAGTPLTPTPTVTGAPPTATPTVANTPPTATPSPTATTSSGYPTITIPPPNTPAYPN